jgi:YhcH/YjgK/YiaL family protein
MVVDTLRNSKQYHSLHPRFKTAFDYLTSVDFAKTENATYELDGKNVYAIVSEYDTKPALEGKWESHLKYYDIQFVAKGEELMGYVNKYYMNLLEEYNTEIDFMLWQERDKGTSIANIDVNFIKFKENNFMILGPDDVHMPGLIINEPKKVKKIVVKVLID